MANQRRLSRPLKSVAGHTGVVVPRVRDRALISVITFAFARIGAVVGMRTITPM
jgi:hypothetical protein